MSSMDYAGERVAKQRKPPKRPIFQPFWSRGLTAYVILTGVLGYTYSNAHGKYGTAFMQAISLMINAWQGWVWVRWLQWSRYYKSPTPKLEGSMRVINWLFTAYVIIYDSLNLLLAHKLPWE